MRISDWSSYVCSSDLRIIPRRVDSLRHPLPRPERMNTPRNKRTSPRPTRRLLVAVVVIALAVLAAWYWKSRTDTADDGAWRPTTVERGHILVAISDRTCELRPSGCEYV